jgi:hypothetical protein
LEGILVGHGDVFIDDIEAHLASAHLEVGLVKDHQPRGEIEDYTIAFIIVG